MKRTSLFLALSILALIFIGPTSGETQLVDQHLVVGDARTLRASYEVGDVAISDSSICQYVIRDNRKEIYLNPTKEGSTTLTIWDAKDQLRDKITIVVSSVNVDAILKSSQEYIEDIPGVRALAEGSKVVLVGEVHSPVHLKQIEGFISRHPEVDNQVKMSSRALSVIAHRIEKAMAIPGITVRPVRGQLIMEGLTYSKDIFKKIDSIARLYDKNIVNLVEMRSSNRRPGYDKTIKLDIYFMEIKNSAIRSFGIQWTPGATPPSSSGGSGGSGTAGGMLGLESAINAVVGFVANLFPKIKWVHQTGRGRILEKPSFIVKSGEEVDFFSGTEVPYFSNDKVEFKEVGIRVNAQPIATSSEIDLKISVDISSLSSTVDRGIDKNKISTTVYVKSDQSVVLGGLIRNADVKTYNKVPKNLDTSSALFTLFLSRDFQTSKSQFYLFITPSIMNSPKPAEMKLKRWLEINKEIENSRKFKK